MSDSYTILLRAGGDAAPGCSREEILRRLRSVPKLQEKGEGRLEFGEADEHGVMTLALLGPDPQLLESIEIRIPRPWVMENGPQVFALVFMIQGWTDWEVYDPQIDSTLHREAVLQGLVAMRQARMQERGQRVPEPRIQDAGGDTGDEIPDAGDAGSKKARWRFW